MNKFLLLQGDAVRIPLLDDSVDLVFGSPPYIDARLYLENGKDLGISRDCRTWVEWMLKVTTEAVRVSRGCVLWVLAGNTRDRNYRPGPEGLQWRWWEMGGYAEAPCYWHRVGISGSGGDQWFRKDVEYIMCFKKKPKLDWSDNTAMGEPPLWAPGGAMSYRLSDGTRRNQWGGGEKSTGGNRKADGTRQDPGRPSHQFSTKAVTRRKPNGERCDEQYVPPVIANPGNYIAIEEQSSVVDVKVGGGMMGHDLAHSSEAPFPEGLCEWFIKSLAPEGGIVCDPFSGSGTTVAVADRIGRVGIGIDLRMSQALIGQQRNERPHKFVRRGRSKKPLPTPMFKDDVDA